MYIYMYMYMYMMDVSKHISWDIIMRLCDFIGISFHGLYCIVNGDFNMRHKGIYIEILPTR